MMTMATPTEEVMPTKTHPSVLDSLTDARIAQQVEKYRQKLLKKRADALLALKNKDIEKAIEELYYHYGNVAITLPALGTMVCQKIGATPENYKVLYESVVEFIRAADWLEVKSGKNGGVRSKRAGFKVGQFGATCQSTVMRAWPTHSRKRSRRK